MFPTILDEVFFLLLLGAFLWLMSVWLSSAKTRIRRQNTPPESPSRSQLLRNLKENQAAIRASRFGEKHQGYRWEVGEKVFRSPQPSKPSLRNTPKTPDTHYHCLAISPHGDVKESCCGTRSRAAEQAKVYLTTGMNTVFLQKKSSLSCQTKAELFSPSSEPLPDDTLQGWPWKTTKSSKHRIRPQEEV